MVGALRSEGSTFKVEPSLLPFAFEQALQNLSSGIFGNIDFVCLALEQLHRDNPLAKLQMKLMAHQLESSSQFKHGRIWHNVLVEAQQFNVQAATLELQNKYHTLRGELSEMTWGGTVQSSRIRHANVHMVLSLLTTTYTRLALS
ncbi:hypothetical protein EDB84DRAFT_1445938 [Lactarius hengduanensis]|nr:hypothetical protein EDB84DRAFT_1445938 [Lactarius hengduanensis]